jgi:hypothetical protein
MASVSDGVGVMSNASDNGEKSFIVSELVEVGTLLEVLFIREL